MQLVQWSSSSFSPKKGLKSIEYLKMQILTILITDVKTYLKRVHDPSMPQLRLKVVSHITLVDFAELFYSGTVRVLKHVLCVVSGKKGPFRFLWS